MGFFTNSSEDQKYSDQKVEAVSKASSFTTNSFDINDLNKEISTSISNVFNSSGISSIWDEIRPYDRWEQWGNFRKGRNTSGLKAYPTPTLTDYSNCVKNDGISVWDENGWWRCLFPKNKIGNSNELTREDVEKDVQNKYGLFFSDYNGFMDWRLKVRTLVKEKQEIDRKNALEAREAANIQGIYDDYAKDTDYQDYGDNNVTSQSKSVYYRTLPNGDAEEITQQKKVYRDGTVKKENFKKTIPKDGSLPVIEQIPEDKEKKLTGWIWNDK